MKVLDGKTIRGKKEITFISGQANRNGVFKFYTTPYVLTLQACTEAALQLPAPPLRVMRLDVYIISIERGGEDPNMSSTLQALEEGAQTVLVVAWLKRTSSV